MQRTAAVNNRADEDPARAAWLQPHADRSHLGTGSDSRGRVFMTACCRGDRVYLHTAGHRLPVPPAPGWHGSPGPTYAGPLGSSSAARPVGYRCARRCRHADRVCGGAPPSRSPALGRDSLALMAVTGQERISQLHRTSQLDEICGTCSFRTEFKKEGRSEQSVTRCSSSSTISSSSSLSVRRSGSVLRRR